MISEGRISPTVLVRALEVQHSTRRGMRLGGILLNWDLLAEKDLLDALAKLHHCPPVEWSSLSSADHAMTELLSPAQATRLDAMPYATEKNGLRVAFINPSDLAAVDEVIAITGRRVLPAVSTEVRLMQAHQRFYARPVSRDVWAVVQKLEAKRLNAEAEQRLGRLGAASLPLPITREGISTPHPPLNLSEIAESLLPLIDESWPAGSEAPPAASSQRDEGHREPPLEEPNPLRDEGPLSNFIADALTFFESKMNLHSALATLEQETIEDPGPSMAKSEDSPARLDPNSTHPLRGPKGPDDKGSPP